MPILSFLFTNFFINTPQQIRINAKSDLYQPVDLGLDIFYYTNSFSHDNQANRPN